MLKFFRHKWAAGDPGVRSLDREAWCSHCSVSTHFTRGCKKVMKGVVEREIDVMVAGLLCTAETEPDAQRDLLYKLW